MPTIELNAKNLETTINDSKILVVDFWADWCGPCKNFAPIFEQASDKYEDVVFAKCDTESQKEVATAFGVRSIPTVAVFRDQTLLFLQSGLLPAEALDELIGKVRDLDMDDVRAELDKAKHADKEDNA